MPDQPDADAPGSSPASGGSGGTVNSQVTDALATLNTLITGGAPANAAAMLELVATNTIGLGMHNAIARQQADAAIAGASIAAACARMLGSQVAPVAPAMPSSVLIAAAEAQAQSAIALIRTQKGSDDALAPEAAEALARIAAAAAPSPAPSPSPSPSPKKASTPKAKAGKTQ